MGSIIEQKPVTTKVLQKMKESAQKISMLTAYDFSFAKILDIVGVDIILVGDSASNVFAGHQTTLPITLDQMIYHASSVVRAVKRSLVVVDLPFGSYQGDSKQALQSAVRIMKESGAHAVKLEGGVEIKESLDRIISAGVPVMGHLGLVPQSIYQFGSYAVRAQDQEEAEKLLKDAEILEQSGCFAVVLEKIPAILSKKVTQKLKIPTIGIGAGVDTDGQVLVLHDMLGINKDFNPRFVRRYAQLYEIISSAIHQYVEDVRETKFPNLEESY